jgi:WD40 repeat protein
MLPGTEDGIVAGFSEDGKTVATVTSPPWSNTGNVLLWDVDTGEGIGSFPIDGVLSHWQPISRNRMLSVPDMEIGGFPTLMPVQVSSNRRIVAMEVKSLDAGTSTISIIDIATSQLLANLPLRNRLDVFYLTPDGETLAFKERGRGIIKLWDIPTGRERLDLFCGRPHCISGDAKLFVSAESPDELGVRSIETGERKTVIAFKTEALSDVIFSPDDAMIVGSQVDGNVIVWEACTGQELATLKGSTNPIFSPNGKRVAALHNGNFRLWDTTDWKVIGNDRRLPFQSSARQSVWIWSGPRSNDIRLVFFADEWVSSRIEWMRFLGIHIPPRESKVMRILDLESWKEIGSYSRHGQVQLLPDGRSFLDLGSTGTAKWNGRPFLMFDTPPSSPTLQILLWPLPFAVAASLIIWLLARIGTRRHLSLMQSEILA